MKKISYSRKGISLPIFFLLFYSISNRFFSATATDIKKIIEKNNLVWLSQNFLLPSILMKVVFISFLNFHEEIFINIIF